MTKINLETKARAGFEAIMLRGGRLVKRKGQVISFAPHVGQLSSVSCGALADGLALGVSLLGGAPAFAGTCDPLAPPLDLNGTAVTCTGPADQAIDVTQEIVGPQITVTTTSGFGISTSVGDGLSLTVGSGYSSGLRFVDTNAIASRITAADKAIDAYAVGRSSITTNATIEGGTYGIKFPVGSGGSLTIDATGSVEGTTLDGINAALTGEARDMTVRAANVTGGRTGIDVVNKAYGNTVVESSNSVTAINGIGIIVSNENPNTENLTVDVVNVTGKAGGIEVGNRGTGATSVSSSGKVASSIGDGISAYNDPSAFSDTDVTNLQTSVADLSSQFSNINTQFERLDQRARQADGGIAAAMALGGTMLLPDTSVSVSFNLATYRGEQGFSGAVVARVKENVWISGGIGGSTVKRSTGGRVGVSFGW